MSLLTPRHSGLMVLPLVEDIAHLNLLRMLEFQSSDLIVAKCLGCADCHNPSSSI
jgi:hypothetical protein